MKAKVRYYVTKDGRYPGDDCCFSAWNEKPAEYATAPNGTLLHYNPGKEKDAYPVRVEARIVEVRLLTLDGAVIQLGSRVYAVPLDHLLITEA